MWLFILVFNLAEMGFACVIRLVVEGGYGVDKSTYTNVECNTLFEECCDDGCCPRFSHSHIWLFAATFSFIIILAIFGCWLICCKRRFERHRHTVREIRPVDIVDSPMVTLVVPDNRGFGVLDSNPVPVTPPPSYEEATRR